VLVAEFSLNCVWSIGWSPLDAKGLMAGVALRLGIG